MDFKHHLEQKGAKSDDDEREDDEYDEEGAFRGGLDDDEGAEYLRMSQVRFETQHRVRLPFGSYTLYVTAVQSYLGRRLIGCVEDSCVSASVASKTQSERIVFVCTMTRTSLRGGDTGEHLIYFCLVCADCIMMFSQQ